MMGVIAAVIVLSHYFPLRRGGAGGVKKNEGINAGCGQKDEELKCKHRIRAYTVSGILSIVCGAVSYIWGISGIYFLNARIMFAVAVAAVSFSVFVTLVELYITRKRPALNIGFAAVMLVMFAWMIISRSRYMWPVAYLFMFGAFYLTDFDADEEKDLFNGLLDGLIIAFLVFQGLCLVFRPYDCGDYRYVGLHSNSNQNSIFYLEVLAAVFTRLTLSYVDNKDKDRYELSESETGNTDMSGMVKNSRWKSSAQKVFWWFASGVVLAFVFMTIGRTAWLLAFLMALVFLILMNKFNGYKRFIRNGLALVLAFVIAFPVSFYAVRYVPALFHHPIWFWGEWSEEKVHSFDPWDSEKYVDMDEFLDAALGRVTYSISNFMEHSPLSSAGDTEPIQNADTNIEEYTSDKTETEAETEPASKTETETEVEAGTENKTGTEIETVAEYDPREAAAVLTLEQGNDSLLVRKTIYSHYITNLNMTGHTEDEQGFQLTPVYWIGHAHNIYLQYGTDFGIPVMVLLVILTIWSAVIYVRRIIKNHSVENMTFLFIMLIPMLFGMLEYSWGVGSLSISMLFIVWRYAFRK
jgi:hypothetical protein